MNGRTTTARFRGEAVPGLRLRIGRKVGDAVTDDQRQELVFSDPALDQFAAAMALKPASLMGWLAFTVARAATTYVGLRPRARPIRREDR